MTPDLHILAVMAGLVVLLAVMNLVLPRSIGKPPGEWPFCDHD